MHWWRFQQAYDECPFDLSQMGKVAALEIIALWSMIIMFGYLFKNFPQHPKGNLPSSDCEINALAEECAEECSDIFFKNKIALVESFIERNYGSGLVIYCLESNLKVYVGKIISYYSKFYMSDEATVVDALKMNYEKGGQLYGLKEERELSLLLRFAESVIDSNDIKYRYYKSKSVDHTYNSRYSLNFFLDNGGINSFFGIFPLSRKSKLTVMAHPPDTGAYFACVQLNYKTLTKSELLSEIQNHVKKNTFESFKSGSNISPIDNKALKITTKKLQSLNV